MEALGGTFELVMVIAAPVLLGVLLAYGIMRSRRRGRPTGAQPTDLQGTSPRDRATDAGNGRRTP